MESRCQALKPETQQLNQDEIESLCESLSSAITLERRGSVRVPFPTPYRWEFREAATANVSRSGMFVQEARVPVGASFDFSIALGQGLSPIQGIGEVIWHSTDENGAFTGAGVHFLELKGDSFSLVRRIVCRHLREGLAASEWRR